MEIGPAPIGDQTERLPNPMGSKAPLSSHRKFAPSLMFFRERTRNHEKQNDGFVSKDFDSLQRPVRRSAEFFSHKAATTRFF